MILSQSFYNRPTLNVAQDLLGCFLIRKIDNQLLKTKIIEVEAYPGPHDLACHASKGCTPRNKVMFGSAGHIYVYFTYGMHYLLNIVTENKNYPAAVLIRAIDPLNKGSDGDLKAIVKSTNGPAKLTKFLKIDKSFYSLPIYQKKSGLWIESRKEEIEEKNIVKTARIGIDYAKEYKDKPWRFYIKDNFFVSKK